MPYLLRLGLLTPKARGTDPREDAMADDLQNWRLILQAAPRTDCDWADAVHPDQRLPMDLAALPPRRA